MLFYVDAGSGSMITQIVVAGAAGAAVVARVGWRRLSAPFRKTAAGGVWGPRSAEEDGVGAPSGKANKDSPEAPEQK